MKNFFVPDEKIFSSPTKIFFFVMKFSFARDTFSKGWLTLNYL
jgi:hypothetical protein